MKYQYSFDTMFRIRQEMLTRDDKDGGGEVLMLKLEKEEDDGKVNKLHKKRASSPSYDDHVVKKQRRTVLGMPLCKRRNLLNFSEI